MLQFLSVIQGQPFVEVHFSKVTITASESELFRQYQIDKVFRKTGTNTYVPVNARTPIRVRAGGSVQLRVRLTPFENRGPLQNVDLTYQIPRNRAGSSGTFEVTGGASAFSGNAFCLFDPTACGGAVGAGAKNFSQILQALAGQPRNDQLIATMTIGPARGKPGSRPAVTKQVRTATQIVTGTRSIPVIITK
jgi:hypothetical protein